MTCSRSHATTHTRLLLGVAAALVLTGCAGPGTDVATDPAGTASTAAGRSGAEPELMSYPDRDASGTEVRSMADARDLAGAPDSFKEFIGATAERLVADSTCEDGYVGVTVKALRTDGYAVGAVNDCGGYVALWALVDGDWKQIDDTQDLWDCTALTKHRVPSDIAGDSCYDRDAEVQRDYQLA